MGRFNVDEDAPVAKKGLVDFQEMNAYDLTGALRSAVDDGEPMLRFFEFKHLPDKLVDQSRH